MFGIVHATSRAASALVLLCLHHASLVHAEGAPDLSFGTQGFVRYEHSNVPEEPNIERGLQIGRQPDGRLVVLAQHRIEDTALADNPLVAIFDPNGGLLRGNLFHTAFGAPPDPPIAGAVIDSAGRALFVGDASGGLFMTVLTAVSTTPSFLYGAELDAVLPVNPSVAEFHRAILGFGNGDILVCGMRTLTLFLMNPMCRLLTASGGIVPTFGNNSLFAPAGTFFLTATDIPNLEQGSILAAHLDRTGRIVLGGRIRLSGVNQDLFFSARLLRSGLFDASYCVNSTCAGATASAPGWRADSIADAGEISKSALIERPDGSIAQVLDVKVQSAQQFASAFLLYRADGALAYASVLQLGEWTRMGGQLGVQSDNKLIVPLSYRPNATTQLGAVLRVPADPAQDGGFDPDFEYAPAGVTPIPGISVIRPNLPGGVPAASVECNSVLVESGSIICAGLVRVSDTPLNLDLLLARISIGEFDPVYAGGFE